MNNQIVLILIIFVICQLISITKIATSTREKEINYHRNMLESCNKTSSVSDFYAKLIVIFIRLYFIYLAVNAVMSFIK